MEETQEEVQVLPGEAPDAREDEEVHEGTQGRVDEEVEPSHEGEHGGVQSHEDTHHDGARGELAGQMAPLPVQGREVPGHRAEEHVGHDTACEGGEGCSHGLQPEERETKGVDVRGDEHQVEPDVHGAGHQGHAGGEPRAVHPLDEAREGPGEDEDEAVKAQDREDRGSVEEPPREEDEDDGVGEGSDEEDDGDRDHGDVAVRLVHRGADVLLVPLLHEVAHGGHEEGAHGHGEAAEDARDALHAEVPTDRGGVPEVPEAQVIDVARDLPDDAHEEHGPGEVPVVAEERRIEGSEGLGAA